MLFADAQLAGGRGGALGRGWMTGAWADAAVGWCLLETHRSARNRRQIGDQNRARGSSRVGRQRRPLFASPAAVQCQCGVER